MKTKYLKEEFDMKEFVKDYIDLCKDSGKFYKKHWKGVIVLNVVAIAGELIWFKRNNIKNRIEEKVRGEES